MTKEQILHISNTAQTECDRLYPVSKECQAAAEALLQKNWPYNENNFNNFKVQMRYTYLSIVKTITEAMQSYAPEHGVNYNSEQGPEGKHAK